MTLGTWLFIVILIVVICLLASYCTDINFKLSNKVLECEMYKTAIQELKYNERKYNYDKEILDAVKFAMKSAHPDNIGGSQEKFIKYRNLYNKLKEG